MANKTPQFDQKIKAILETTELGERTCPLTGEKWQFNEQELNWCKAFQAPPASLSPRARMQYLMAFRTGYEIFWNKHALTGKPILSYIHPDIKIPVIEDKEWHAMDIDEHPEYQFDYDPSRPVVDQLVKMIETVPMGARRETKNVVNTIGVGMWDVEDCFMIFSTVGVKRSFYTYYCLEGSEDVMQGVFVLCSQNCFDATRIERCHSCVAAFESRDCLNCKFIFDCRNCENCFGATNLRNAQYVFFGEQLTKEEYDRRVAEIDLSDRNVYQQMKERFVKLVEQAPFPESFNINAPDCEGEYLTDCVRCSNAHYLQRCTDCHYIYGSRDSENVVYTATTYPGNNCWMSAQIWHGNNYKYCMNCGTSNNMEYCFNCHESENCFGCVGLNRKKFHIFNKPYSEEEYWSKVDQIKCAMLDRGEYGEFFPLSTSPNGVQFSIGSALYDMSEEDMKKIGGPIYDPDRGAVLGESQGQEKAMREVSEVPEKINEVGADWSGQPFMDESVHRRWSVMPRELSYLKEHHLPFPTEHYSQRLRHQFQMLNLFDTEEATCAKCEKSMRVHKNKTFKNRTIYCEPCYLAYLQTR